MKRFPIYRRKIIFLTARVHAAETAGSFKMEGVLSFLTSIIFTSHIKIGNDPLAQNLRNIYIFKIVPLLNPEGVLCGNFRCSFTGTDLNRRWDQPDKILHSQIFQLKSLLRKLVAENKQILVFCDLHGHSKKNGSFIYGCNQAANGGFCSWTKVRLLPRILARKTHLFSYKDCKFRIENDKQRTARVVVWREFSVTNSFTLESSFYGYPIGNEIIPFTAEDYNNIGESFILSLLDYHNLLKGIEKELKINHGWLKPSRLKSLTGIPAAELLAKKKAKDKDEMKKKQRQSKIKSIIDAKKIKKPKKKSRKEFLPSGKSSTNLDVKDIKALPLLEYKKETKHHKISNKSKIETNPVLPDISPILNNDETNAQTDTKILLSDNDENEENSWRAYFSQDEIEDVFEKIEKGIDPNEVESEEESESNPSEDNLDKEDMQDFLQSFPTKEIEVQQIPQKKPLPPPVEQHQEPKKIQTHIDPIVPTRVSLPWESNYSDCPSIVISSKNTTRAASLINKSRDNPTKVFFTHSRGKQFGGIVRNMLFCPPPLKLLSASPEAKNVVEVNKKQEIVRRSSVAKPFERDAKKLEAKKQSSTGSIYKNLHPKPPDVMPIGPQSSNLNIVEDQNKATIYIRNIAIDQRNGNSQYKSYDCGSKISILSKAPPVHSGSTENEQQVLVLEDKRNEPKNLKEKLKTQLEQRFSDGVMNGFLPPGICEMIKATNIKRDAFFQNGNHLRIPSLDNSVNSTSKTKSSNNKYKSHI